MTASVPFSAPAIPPLTGASTAVIPFAASPSATRAATVEPVVETSMKIFTLLPSPMPLGPSATACTIGGVGRAREHDLGSRSNGGRGLGPRCSQLHQRRYRVLALVVNRQIKTGRSKRRTIGPPMRPTPTKPIVCFAIRPTL